MALRGCHAMDLLFYLVAMELCTVDCCVLAIISKYVIKTETCSKKKQSRFCWKISESEISDIENTFKQKFLAMWKKCIFLQSFWNVNFLTDSLVLQWYTFTQ